MKAIILAAGQGKRMKSDLPKVLHPILGKTIIRYVVEAALSTNIKPQDITVVVSPKSDDVKNELTRTWQNLNFATQDEPKGTAHAVLMATTNIQPNEDVLVLCGDMPLINNEFLSELISHWNDNPSSALVTAVYCENSSDFGRVYATDEGIFEKIVEYSDLTDAPPPWANTGVYLFKGKSLLAGLDLVDTNNSQGELYLTDVPYHIKNSLSETVRVLSTRISTSVFTGINNQIQLAQAATYMQERINSKHMLQGVRMLNPSSVFIDDAVEIDSGVIIYPNVILEGNCKIAKGTVIGANTQMKNTEIDTNVSINNSVLDSAKVGSGTTVGPFAYLRPGTVLGKGCRVGNFVEIKNANLDDGAKMAHLAYIGDADVGKGVNYSCGAITANYDGEKKHRTIIGDGAFIGCNSNLVAPVEIGTGAFVAAGSTITKDLPAGSLGIARARQVEKLDYKK